MKVDYTQEGLMARQAKINKMFPKEVLLGTCPKCGCNAVIPEMNACLKCDWVGTSPFSELKDEQ